MANHTTTSRATAKRRRISDHHRHHRHHHHHHRHQSLLPGLPDHIAHLCLSLISPSALYSVCRSWRRLIYSGDFPPFPSLYTLSLPTTGGVDAGETLRISSFDPISAKWTTVDSPAPPLPPDLHRVSHRHPSFMSRSLPLPIQSLSVSGNLLLIAATSVHRNIPFPAFTRPIMFDPLSNKWSSCPPLSTPRRWCAAGAVKDTVVVASGIGTHYTETVARSVEKWVHRKSESCDRRRRDSIGNCEKIQSLTNSIIKTESFEEMLKDSDKNYEKIQSLTTSIIKTESIDEMLKDSIGNCENIQSLKIKTESFDEMLKDSIGNCEKIQSLKTKTESFDEMLKESTENSEKIQSLTTSIIKTESIDEMLKDSIENCENIQSLKIKTETFDEMLKDSIGNCEKIQSLKIKTESFDEMLKESTKNCQKIQSLTNSTIKTESKLQDSSGNWEKMRSLKHSKLCREAIDAVGWKKKLYMVNVKGDYAKEGFVYDPDSDEWAEMPMGMLGGWRGPTAAMAEETMYAVDESRGVLRRYDEGGDKWSEVVVDERLKGAEHIAAGGGRVCVVGGKTAGIVVVDVVATPPRLWVVETPPGEEILGLHILPRVCR